MKKSIFLCMVTAALLLTYPAMAAKRGEPNYTLKPKGIVVQNAEDRAISPQAELSRHPLIDGESPTTGLPVAQERYMPMVVTISNAADTLKVNGKNVNSSGIGKRAPWGCQFADILYEGILYRTGETRMSFLFSDSFAEGKPESVGPIRSVRSAQVLLQREWQGGIVFSVGMPDGEEAERFRALEYGSSGVVFNVKNEAAREHFRRVRGVKGLKSPENLEADLAALRELIPAQTVATPRPFLFFDESPYGAGYEPASSLSLDWGKAYSISHFFYDGEQNLYSRYCGKAPYLSFVSAENREETVPMTFSNVIVQRVDYQYQDGLAVKPLPQTVGRGNADIFIGGQYIPGYWVHASEEEPTVFLDDQGNELMLARGKTYIAQFPNEALLAYQNSPQASREPSTP